MWKEGSSIGFTLQPTDLHKDFDFSVILQFLVSNLGSIVHDGPRLMFFYSY